MSGRLARKTVSIKFGCGIEKVAYQSRGLGKVKFTQYKTWRETFSLPEQGYDRTNVGCPICHSPFQVKVWSKSKARRRKLYFALCFFTIAAFGIVFGVFAYGKEGSAYFMGYSIAVPFILFAVWQFLNANRGRFDPSDVVSHAGGKTHRIFDEQKIIFPDQ